MHNKNSQQKRFKYTGLDEKFVEIIFIAFATRCAYLLCV